MPEVRGLRRTGYRFLFWSIDREEPPHIHVASGDKICKWWLEPVSLASSRNYAQHELTRIRKLVHENREQLLEAWHEHFQ